MKRNSIKFLSLLLVITLCTTALCIPAFAAEQTTNVRVNGYRVRFPDQQPIIDENSRTLIPVRFVAEELGAKVSWDGVQAIIEKDGITVNVPIDSNELTVIDPSGSTKTVEMDTAAVLKNGRTLVPIRFVAEAMGAWVSYSNSFNTVQIYDDVLTAKEIEEVHGLSYGWDFGSAMAPFQSSGSTFEDLHEQAFQQISAANAFTIKNSHDGQTWNSGSGTIEELANLFVRYARESVANNFSYSDYGIHATFRTDASCIINSPGSVSVSPYVIYGYLTITCDSNADVAAYKNRLSGAKLDGLQAGSSKTYLVETFWMPNGNTQSPSNMGLWNRTGGSRSQWY